MSKLCAIVAAALLIACARTATHTQLSATPEAFVDAAIVKAIGLPVYPNATPTEGGGVSVLAGRKRVIAAYYRTDASLAKVEEFYAGRLPHGSLKAFINQQGAGTANFSFAPGKVFKQVTLSGDPTGTIIALSVTSQEK